jgi:phosphatidylglycerol---prolipoprotein diacylglyceryl transferase
VIPFHNINSTLVQIGPVKIHWYGVMYILAFTLGGYLLQFRAKETHLDLSKETLSDFVFYLFLGVLLGGRLGYILFYDPIRYFSHFDQIIRVWEGGMSFHGGFIGTLVAGLIFCYKNKLDFYKLADTVLPAIPLGLGLGRLGNFINGELYGRAADVPWSMIFPMDPYHIPRHPSQLYELGLEGILLFSMVWMLRKRALPSGAMFWLFIAGYGLCRIFGEFFREPDAQLSFLFPNTTAGMILSMPMFLIGGFMFIQRYQSWSKTK